MNRLIDVLAAFEAGKLPSHDQVHQFLEWLKTDVLSEAQPSSFGGLSSQGRLLADRVRDVLTAYQLMGEHKNKDNVLQETFWHLSQSDYSSSSVEVDTDIKADEVAKDFQKIQSSLRTILEIFLSGISSEGASLFQDFGSFVRLSLADAAEVLESRAAHTKDSLRETEEEVQEGKRDSLGRDKERMKEEEDTKVAFEHAMDTLKDAGSSAIGAGQQTAAKASELADQTSTRLQNAFVKMCERAQKDEAYHETMETLLGTIQKWLSQGFDTATNVAAQSASLDSLIFDPTPEQHVHKALRGIETLISRLSHTTLSEFVTSIRQCAFDIREDDDLRHWFDDFFTHLHKDLNEVGYISSDEAKHTRKDLRTRWKEMLDVDSDFGRQWKKDFEQLRKEMRKFHDGLRGDEDLNRLKDAHQKLGQAIERGLVEASSDAQSGMQAVVEKITWFWQDLFKVYVPRLLVKLKDASIPRIEYKDPEAELVLEKLDVSSFNILPSHIYMRNITDVDIVVPALSSAPVQPETQVQLGTLTHLRAQAVQFELKDISFYFKDKQSMVGPSDFSGRVSFNLPPKGIDIDLKMRLIPASAETTLAPVSTKNVSSQPVPTPVAQAKTTMSQRALYRSFHVIEKLEVHITDDVDLRITESNHPIIVSAFKPIFVMRFQDALKRALEAQIEAVVKTVDGLAFDVSERAQVFRDTGLGAGASYAAAFWSEFGRLRRSGFLGGSNETKYAKWRATGTGMIVEEMHVDPETGEQSSRMALAVGAEPQILSGEKRGPEGTASVSMKERIRTATGQMAEDVGADMEAIPQAMEVDDMSAQVEGVLEEGKKQVATFMDAVQARVTVEKRKQGWQSSAFSV